MAWLVENVPKMPGVGIIYCLTVSDCYKVSNWLQKSCINARAYTGQLEAEERKLLEDLFMQNGVKCLVATIALGMGYDKADIGFVIHYQRPGNVVSYYQQIGRAGRRLDNAYAILLNGIEDDEIQEYFINTAFPTQAEMRDVVSVIEHSVNGLKQNQILRLVNMRANRLEKCIKYLEVVNVISKGKDGKYYRTVNEWSPDLSKSEMVTERRYEELQEMKQFVDLEKCYMQFIAQKLDDPMIVLVNNATRFTVAIYQVKKKDLKNLEVMMKKAISNTLLFININPEIVEEYMRLAGDIKLAQNRGRQTAAWVSKAGLECSFYVGRE